MPDFFHILDFKQFHPQLNQVVPRQPYVGQWQQLPERTEGVAAHFHHKVTFPKLMRMATIIIIITIVILNKSLSGKWRGRILGNTLAGASKIFRAAWYVLYRTHEKTATTILWSYKVYLEYFTFTVICFVCIGLSGIFYNFIIFFFKDL